MTFQQRDERASGRTDERERLLRLILGGHDRAIRRIASAYGGATGESEDLRQEILLRIWQALPSYRADAAVGTWAYRVALNTALTWKRSTRGEQPARRHGAEPMTTGLARDTEDIFNEFLATLGSVDRSVLVFYAEGLTAPEIGDVLGLTANAVAVRLHRLKQRYTRDYLEP